MKRRKGNDREENWIIRQLDAKRQAGEASRSAGETAVTLPADRSHGDRLPDHRKGS